MAAQPPVAAPRSSRGWLWWVAGGCALVVVLVIAGAALGGYAMYNRLMHGGYSCLPSSFPTYPGSTYGGQSYELNGQTPGSSCHMVFESNDSASSITDFYASRLTAGNWRVVSSNSETGVVAFRNVKVKATGTVEVKARGNHSEIAVQLYS